METDWTKVAHFKPQEWVKDPRLIHPEAVYLADAIREHTGWPMIIHFGYDPTGHSEDPPSLHYLQKDGFAWAFDFHFMDPSLLEAWLELERWKDIGGLGIYPWWQNPGFHIDIRRGPRRGRWWRDQNGQYQAVNRDFLRMLDGWLL